MRRGPPLRRVAQTGSLIATGVVLLAVCIGRIADGSRVAWLGLLLWLAVLAWALDAFLPVLGRGAVTRGEPASPARVALTFDDGPSGDTPAVLAALAKANVVASFFMLGRHAERHPDLVRAVAAAGHVIGNHTYSHRTLALCGRRTVTEEVARTDAVLEKLGVPRPAFFRAPRGFQGPLVRAVLRARGLRLVAWTRGAWDSERRLASEIAALATAHPKDGDILLLHDGAGTPGEQRRDRTAEAIPMIVEAYRRRGFRFVTLTEMLEKARE
jgi:peptidoglycan/xylan/chitin deacetylase (PgdA/CDA1 family)